MKSEDVYLLREAFDIWQKHIYHVNLANGWFDKARGFSDDISLLHAEVSEAFEEYRNDDWDKLIVELADVFIRLMDTCYRRKIDLASAVNYKVEKNKTRPYRHGNKVV